MSDSRSGLGKQVAIAAMGGMTSAITSVALAWIQVHAGFAVYSVTWCFLVPVGAIAAGALASTGYLLGARAFHMKPVGGIAWNMAWACVGTYFLVHYLVYFWMEQDGTRVREVVGFWTYLDFTIRNTRLERIGGSDPGGELGATWGYVYASLQLAGFAGGGLFTYAFLSSAPYCDLCTRYARKADGRKLYANDENELVARVGELRQLLADKRYQEAVDLCTYTMGSRRFDSQGMRTVLTLHRCDVCRTAHLSLDVARKAKREWKDLGELQVRLWMREDEDHEGDAHPQSGPRASSPPP